MFSCRATDCASFGLALPVNTIRLSKAMSLRRCGSRCMAGEEGFEPTNAGIKIRCLNQLGDSPTVIGSIYPVVQRMPVQSARHEAAHPFWKFRLHPARFAFLCKFSEYARP